MGQDPRMTDPLQSAFRHSSDKQHGSNISMNAILAVVEPELDNGSSLIHDYTSTYSSEPHYAIG